MQWLCKYLPVESSPFEGALGGNGILGTPRSKLDAEPDRSGYTQCVATSSRTALFRLLLLPLLLSQVIGCNSLNPLCGSARPAPVLDSISPTTLDFSQLQPIFVLTATGSHFVSSSVVIFNGATLGTTVVSSTQLTVTITSAMITAPGTFNVVVKTPAGNSGSLGCTSGGTSAGQVLTVH